MQEHPDAQSYRNRTLPSYNDLFLIYGNGSIDGWHLEAENYAGSSLSLSLFTYLCMFVVGNIICMDNVSSLSVTYNY